MNLLIRADASPEIGTGHVMRCLALAQAWQDAGGNAIFLMSLSTPAIQARLTLENCKIVPLAAAPGSEEDAELTDRYASENGVEWLVVDGYKFDAEYQAKIRNGDRRLLCVDDAGKCDRYVADVILNQNVTAVRKHYSNCLPGAQLLLGPSFCLLRREFTPWRKCQRKISAKGRHVLVTLGGSTPVEAGIRVMESLGSVKIENLRAIFIVGGSSMDEAALKTCAVKFPKTISIRRDVSNMAELMAEADVAISAAGSTCWELCLLGLPSILLDVADNQIPVAIELEKKQCMAYAGNGNNVCPDQLARTVENLLASSETRVSMSQRSRQLVDGLGAERVVSAMLELGYESCAATLRGLRA